MTPSRFQKILHLFQRLRAGAVLLLVALNFMTPLSPAATLTTLVYFDNNCTSGCNPVAGLIVDADGNLYGTTTYGGASDAGTVFRLDAATNNLTTLASFNVANGAIPHAGLIADADGNLYGTTAYGGSGGMGGRGTVFRLDAATNNLTTLANFNGANGAEPRAGLIADAAGNLYGTTTYGGASDAGTVFRLDAATNNLTTLASFSGANGALPIAGLIADAVGNLYGTATYGGASDAGTVFRLDAATNNLTTLASFSGANGAYPRAGLVADADGNLYGTTYTGGANNAGTVFRLDAATNNLTTLASFNGTNGALPHAGLIADAAGNLYGTTTSGGTNNVGTVFRLDAATNTLTTLASLGGAHGAYPYAGLVADADGNLYGTTLGGEGDDQGSVFRLSDTGFVVVPEPGTLALGTMGLCWVLMRTRRARQRDIAG